MLQLQFNFEPILRQRPVFKDDLDAAYFFAKEKGFRNVGQAIACLGKWEFLRLFKEWKNIV